MSQRLQYQISTPADLTETVKSTIYDLFASCYTSISRQRFESDLNAKNAIVTVHDEVGTIRGFSTQSWFDWQHDGATVQILFSGDTVMQPGYWGNHTLAKGWCQIAARLLKQQPHRRLYWFLISKGYRTYLYLPLFFRHFTPGLADEHALAELLENLASAQFGAYFNPDSGLIEFPLSLGQLTPELAAIPAARLSNPDVRFFLERNPNYAAGVELACLAEVSLASTHDVGRRWLETALQS